MIPKLDNSFLTFEKGVKVIIKNALNLNKNIGTELV